MLAALYTNPVGAFVIANPATGLVALIVAASLTASRFGHRAAEMGPMAWTGVVMLFLSIFLITM